MGGWLQDGIHQDSTLKQVHFPRGTSHGGVAQGSEQQTKCLRNLHSSVLDRNLFTESNLIMSYRRGNIKLLGWYKTLEQPAGQVYNKLSSQNVRCLSSECYVEEMKRTPHLTFDAGVLFEWHSLISLLAASTSRGVPTDGKLKVAKLAYILNERSHAFLLEFCIYMSRKFSLVVGARTYL